MNTQNKNLIPHDFGRHGEVILKRVAGVPEGARLVESGASIIVGHSESGHHHALTIEREAGVEIKMYELDGRTYLDLPVKGNLVHQKEIEKHDTQVFLPGTYERTIRHAYSYAEKIMTRILD